MPSQWDDAMVSAWMTSCMPLIASEYIIAFRDNAVNGELLLELNETDLLELGITKRMHMARFLKELSILRDVEANGRNMLAAAAAGPGPASPSQRTHFAGGKKEG